MESFDPLELAAEVEGRYRRYLETTFQFRDPEFRKSFIAQLESGHLAKGPYVEAAGSFQTGATLRGLVAELGIELDGATGNALTADRPLFRHQERAISRLQEGNNVVVATGTGSGKTEAFLYPILLHLYDEFCRGILDDGVRALVLYPMNALANDQRDRLGTLYKSLVESGSEFRFTYGQYIGDTPEDARDQYRGGKSILRESSAAGFRDPTSEPNGELVFRSEMRERPPHILLTNYSMLEYLLLRPLDSPLFDKGKAQSWRFLVLDEAHQYRGSRGIEMAMLLRRLKQRLRTGGRRDGFTCIATSATLTSDRQDQEPAAAFASSLFTEPFERNDIIAAEREPLPEARSRALDIDSIRLLIQRWPSDEQAAVQTAAQEVDVALTHTDESARALASVLEFDPRVIQLRALLEPGPMEAGLLAEELFPEEAESNARTSLLAGLLSLLAAAERNSGGPLLSIRYHSFLRALEGAYIRYSPSKRVSLDRRSADSEGDAYFEVALCKECGQHYLVGRKGQRTGHLREPLRDSSDPDFGVSYFRPIEGPVDDEHVPASGDDASDSDDLVLCTTCGKLGEDQVCEHDTRLTVRLEREANAREKPDELAACGACGYTASGRDPVREIVHGTDGPHAVIATGLYSHLPSGRRKLLAFADGRQEAAFFAWYLQSSYEDIAAKSRFLRVVREWGIHSSQGLSINELGRQLAAVMRDDRAVPPSQGDIETRQQAWADVYRDFALLQPRLSLEGVGLIRWQLLWPPDFELPQALSKAPWNLDEGEARSLIELLLSSLRLDRGFDLRPPGDTPLQWSDAIGTRSQTRFALGAPGGAYSLRSWEGARGRRSRFLSKLLSQDESTPDNTASVQRILIELWEAFDRFGKRQSNESEGLLVPQADGRVLNPDWWRATAPSDLPLRCTTCGRLHWVGVHDHCSSANCQGRTKRTRRSELERNHYRAIYQADMPPTLTVEEHTAQLDRELARKYQRMFRDGQLNVLSSSTTFELGVDLGDLDVVFLRNVPPESFNYVQRVGRAGRRRGHPGFAITYCRRSSHDLYHFAEPSRMLRGVSRPPILKVSNEKIISRHLVALVLSAFFREHPERFGSVDALLGDFAQPSFARDVASFATATSDDLSKAAAQILPDHMSQDVYSEHYWSQFFATGDAGRRLELAELEVAWDYESATAFKRHSVDQDDYRGAEWAKRRADTIADENVLSFLSRKAVIPKYGFPVDVVELDARLSAPQGASRSVNLQRDLKMAISEFAPSSKLIANKKVWTSHALKRVPEKEWTRRGYYRCQRHATFQEWDLFSDPPPSPCGCRLAQSEYVIPQFGFTTSRKPPQDPVSRFGRLFTTRPYFAGPVGEDAEGLPALNDVPRLSLTASSPGRMVVICEGNRGKGFYVCEGCGTGTTKRTSQHNTPYGIPCRARMTQVSLGHEFVTDVVLLKLDVPPEGDRAVWMAYSVAFALVEATAEVLEVPSTDLSATVRAAGTEAFPPIVLYDNVPGGAGLVAGLEDPHTLKECLHLARQRVGGQCGCDELSSCYGCIRSYQNQFAHPHLRRGDAGHILDDILEGFAGPRAGG